MKVDFSGVTAAARQMREHFQEKAFTEPNYAYENHYRSEYCYQLVSLLNETQKLLNKEFFSPDYIEEKADTLARLADQIRRMEIENANRNQNGQIF